MVCLIFLLGLVVSTSAFLDSFWLSSKNNCTSKEFVCRNGNCIPHSSRCNDNNDCGDGSDEEACELVLCKEPVYFRCKNKRCISKSFVCDGEDDCADFSDEEDCSGISKPAKCDEDQWQCSDKKLCIPNDWVCNGEMDCADHSDEVMGCTSKVHCDGFKCKNGHCIPNEWICDGNDDCNDKSDEQNCEHHFNIKQCNLDQQKFLCLDNTTCIDVTKTCDNHPDCPDKSDEGIMCTIATLSCAHHNCSHECVQLPSGPKCVCPVGYHNIDEKNCRDVNECERYGICDQKCRNTAGSYECYCDNRYVLEPDRRSCKAEGGEGMMVFSSKREIRGYTLESGLYYSVAKNLKQVVGVHYDGNHIYWTDISAEHESIVRSIEDGSKREILVTSGLGLTEDLAVDWLTGNIYFTDTEKQHIGVCTNNGEHCTVLVNRDIRKPRGIVLNVELGDMYWTDWGQPAEIAYSLMDGTDDRSFVSDNIHWPNGLALDYPNERLYWTDARKMSLESIRIDGTDRRIVLEDIVKHPYAIAVFESHLYWSDWATHSIQSCEKFFGKGHHTIIKESKDYIYGMSIFHSVLHTRSDNPCDGAFCSDICLLRGEDGYSCACPQNKVLNADKHTCREVDNKQMLILGFKNTLLQVEHQLLGKHDVSSLPSMVKNLGCLTFDSVNNVLLISDLETRQIITTDLSTGLSKPLNLHSLGKIIAMSYDPMGNNLYMCDEEKAIVEVVSLNTMSRKILLHDMQGEIPESITLVPEEGVMFVALRIKGNPISHIDRLAMDGSARTHVIEEGLVGPVTVHYDFDVHRVFFADAGTGNIESTSVEGDDRHSFRVLTTYPIGLTSLNYDLFWVNEHSKKLYWAEKNITTVYNKKITLDITDDIERLHLTSVTQKKHHVSSPCHINNGGCTHLCLMSHKSVTCACPAGWDLLNNYTCTKRQHCDATEFLCYDSNTCILSSLQCNGHNDCSFGEDEKDCKPVRKCPLGLFECNDGECIELEKMCDYNYDCKDKSDEYDCEDKHKKRSCPPLHFNCGEGQCIAERFVCDGSNDCSNGADEEHCSSKVCNADQFRCNSGLCIPKSWECDHEYDCKDFSDEHTQCASVSCPSTMHTCSNGKCLDKQLLCDKQDDCGDGSDESSCDSIVFGNCALSEFACSSNTSICVPNSAKCNGTAECPDKEDEKECSDCNVDEFPCDNKKCIPTQWACDKLDDCGDNSDEKTELCSNTSDATVSFIHTSCDDGFRCKSGHCISISSVCDGKHDCYDDSDEDGLCSVACDRSKQPCSQDCISTPTGPMCKCKSGYRLTGDGHTCEDINECRSDPPVCSQLCNNNDGDYICDCFNGFLLRADKASCKAEGPPMSLIFTSENQIRSLTQKTNSLSVVYKNDLPKITGLDFIHKTQNVYFSIEMTGTLHRINQKTQIREYIEHVGQPQMLSVDWVTQNVYFYDASSKSISVCNFEEMLCAKLLSFDIHRQISAIAVDSVNKVVFYALASWWVFNSPSFVLFKANLDGSNKMELIKFSTGYVTGLTFDFNKKQLYLLDHQNSQISMIDYDGKMKTVLFSTQPQSVTLKFFEDNVFYLTKGGEVFRCKLFGKRICENFKLHNSYSDNLFTIVHESLQTKLENVCSNHTCSYLCLPSESHYKCLCKDGYMVSSSEKCPADQGASDGEEKKFTVHSVSVKDESKGSRHSGVIIMGILIPILLILLITAVAVVVRKRNSDSLNVSSIRFYNPDSKNQHAIYDEKPLLQRGQHEYINPLLLDDAHTEVSASIS